MTPLDKPMKRALTIDGREYTLLLTPAALRLTEKGHRTGIELAWDALVSGDAALAAALRASLGAGRGGARRGKISTPVEKVASASRGKPTRSGAPLPKPSHRRRPARR